MDYVRTIDFAALAAAAANERVDLPLLVAENGATHARIRCIKTPPGGGSPEGLHTHAVDQIFYIISGVMNLTVADEDMTAGPGALVVFPAGVPHRNWNGGTEPTVHLAIDVPLPDPNVPFARPVE